MQRPATCNSACLFSCPSVSAYKETSATSCGMHQSRVSKGTWRWHLRFAGVMDAHWDGYSSALNASSTTQTSSIVATALTAYLWRHGAIGPSKSAHPESPNNIIYCIITAKATPSVIDLEKLDGWINITQNLMPAYQRQAEWCSDVHFGRNI